MKTLKVMSKIWIVIAVLLTGFSFTGCKYTCVVTSYGTSPGAMTYFVEPLDSSSYANPLQFQEYKRVLDSRLREMGYVETDEQNAKMLIQFGYYFGEKQFAGFKTTTYGNTNTYTNSNTNRTSVSSASSHGNSVSSASVSSSNNNTRTNTYNSTTTSEEANYQYDYGCIINAYYNKTFEPVWSVEAYDNYKSSDDKRVREAIREAMKWAITAACMKIGDNRTEEVDISWKTGESMGLRIP